MFRLDFGGNEAREGGEGRKDGGGRGKGKKRNDDDTEEIKLSRACVCTLK